MKLSLRGIVFSALMAAILVLFGYISIPIGFSPVPITLQTLAVMLAGGLLGPLYGFLSVTMVVLLTALGFPLLHGTGGLAVLLGPTGGYVMMWPISALLIGLLLARINIKGVTGFMLAFVVFELFGSLLVYVSGVPWLAYAYKMDLPEAMIQGFYPYIIGDLIKAVFAAIIIAPVRIVFPPQRLTGNMHSTVIKADS
ncbi:MULTISPECIES: biotin transporter BioY [unclassified Paenibacillus]|jgi:biotin transport system substrate-specific component|uniref:biotin transporter BioY n=1 Tax=unclassified Paenibacillus TaxID=185978 RepID=UPI00088BBAD4|nr:MULTISPECIES: biotin transporter BioY [unclassified Paenibacillus]PRA07207.1 biotin transporter BioY [Paenibacillus sp. MYb63]PRA50853.1 biotin transporter BioY [Paenibacillus sp. MYb67]SDC69623.1 biotin transport system substrate-specific component [Paenibacillus sp. CF095]